MLEWAPCVDDKVGLRKGEDERREEMLPFYFLPTYVISVRSVESLTSNPRCARKWREQSQLHAATAYWIISSCN